MDPAFPISGSFTKSEWGARTANSAEGVITLLLSYLHPAPNERLSVETKVRPPHPLICFV
jgi:hypothetical protein